MNAKLRLAVGLILMLALQACTSTPRKEVTYLSKSAQFTPSDKIVIDQVLATSPTLVAGDVVVVRGHYSLNSRSDAVLSLAATSYTRPSYAIRSYESSSDFLFSTPSDYPAAIFARKGEHPFELKYQVPNSSELRLELREVFAPNYLTHFSERGPSMLGVVTFKPVLL